MNVTSFDASKPVETRAGFPATINRTDLKNPLYPIGATYVDQAGEENMSVFTKTGHYSVDEVDHPNDLVNAGSRFKITCWLNVYPTRVYAFQTKEQADAQAAFLAGRIKCIDCSIDLPA